MMDRQLDSVCRESSAYASRLEELPLASPLLRAVATKGAREIRRSLARFDSKLLLMATIGSVKSGKSTLTNCLAHRRLCATKLGIETTRLPTVILASDDGTERMELFSPLAADSLSEQELFELVIDYLRHVAPPEFTEKVAVERLHITQSHLDAWAQGHTSASCAAIFLVEPEARLLQAGIGIVDMPGMDGLTSNWHDEKLHEWMNENADYFLLVQSSFAALTPDTRDYLRTAMERSQRPIRIVQNRIEAQFWLPPTEQEQQQEQQQVNTQKQLGDFIRKVIPGSWVNAGLAWWQQETRYRLPSSPGKSDTGTPNSDTPASSASAPDSPSPAPLTPNTPSPKTLTPNAPAPDTPAPSTSDPDTLETPPRNKSNLPALEDEILADLRHPEVTLRRNSADYLLKTLEGLDTRLKDFVRESQGHISQVHDIQASIHRLLDAARVREAIESNNLHEGRLRCGYLADQARQTLYTRLDAILDLAVDGYFPADWMANELPARELNLIRTRVENDLGDLAAEQETNVLSPAKICELTELEKEKIRECARILHRRAAEEIEKDYIKAILNVWKPVPLDCSPITLGALKETALLGMLNRNGRYDKTTPEWRRTGRATIAARLELWKNKVGEALDMFISRRVQALETCLLTELQRYEDSEQIGRSIATAEKDIDIAQGLRDALAPTLLAARQIQAQQ